MVEATVKSSVKNVAIGSKGRRRYVNVVGMPDVQIHVSNLFFKSVASRLEGKEANIGDAETDNVVTVKAI
jgi:hypothetical protein